MARTRIFEPVLGDGDTRGPTVPFPHESRTGLAVARLLSASAWCCFRADRIPPPVLHGHWLRPQGDDPLDSGPDEFAALMRNEIARWTKVAHAAGMIKS